MGTDTTCERVDMKYIYEVMQQKDSDLRRVETEIEALHTVIPLLADRADWLEHGVIVRSDDGSACSERLSRSLSA